MGRAPCCDKANVKKGPWAPEEDAKLKDYIHQHGTGGNWIALPQKAGLKRCGKSCRLRWLNYLRPNIKHGEFSEDEERIICSLFTRIGSRWSVMASQLPGRTDNDIKNYWNTKLKKKILMGMASYTQFDEKMPQKATNYTPLSPLKSQFSSSYSEFRDCDPNFPNFKSKASFSSSSTVNNGNKINHLVFRGAASCSPSDGNLCCFSNGDDDGTQETVMASERWSSDEKATTSGLFGGNPLDKYDIKDIKQMISTNSICCNNLNFFVDEIMTEEKYFTSS